VPHGITQCYLPPGRGDIPALTPAEAGTRTSNRWSRSHYVCTLSVCLRVRAYTAARGGVPDWLAGDYCTFVISARLITVTFSVTFCIVPAHEIGSIVWFCIFS